MKHTIACISDCHGKLPMIPPADFLIIAGDICPHHPDRSVRVGSADDIFYQAQWLSGPFADWLNQLPVKEVVATWGNHDCIGQKRPDMVAKNLRWHLLVDAGIEINGLKIYGSPWQPYFHDWYFNAPDGPEGEVFLDRKFSLIPESVDILLVHGPPKGYGDVAPDGRSCGSTSLLNHVMRTQPKLSVHGHIHCGRGSWTYARGNASDGIICNASVLNEAYQLVHPALVFDIEV